VNGKSVNIGKKQKEKNHQPSVPLGPSRRRKTAQKAKWRYKKQKGGKFQFQRQREVVKRSHVWSWIGAKKVVEFKGKG